MATSETSNKGMKKNLGLATATSIVVGCVIGAGVFFKPYAIYQATGGAPGMGGALGMGGNPYMQNNMQRNDQPCNPYLDKGPVKTDNPSIQGNPYAGFGINQNPAQNNAAPMGQPFNTQSAGQNAAMNTEPVSMQAQQAVNSGAEQAQDAGNIAAEQTQSLWGQTESPAASAETFGGTVSSTASATESISSGASVTESSSSTASATESSSSGVSMTESISSAPAPMGPLNDDRPSPSPMGELKTQMPNTAPNPFLQNLENLKNNTDDTNNT